MIQIWVGQLCRYDKVNLPFEVITDLLLNFLHRQFWLEVPLSVELCGLYVSSNLTIFISCLQNNTISRYLLFVAKNYNVTDFYVLKLCFDDSIRSVFKSSYFVNGSCVDFII